MQFVRSRIAAPRPTESRSVVLWKQLVWFVGDQGVCDFSAAELRIRGQSPSELVSAAGWTVRTCLEHRPKLDRNIDWH